MAENEEPRSSLYYMNSIKCCLDSIETPALVELYRPLIARCVKVDDIVFYFDDVIHTGNVIFIWFRLRINWAFFFKSTSVTCNENLIFELALNLRKKLRKSKINFFRQKFQNCIDFSIEKKNERKSSRKRQGKVQRRPWNFSCL